MASVGLIFRAVSLLCFADVPSTKQHEEKWKDLLVEVQVALDNASQGRYTFSTGQKSNRELALASARTSPATTTLPTGPVKRIYSTKAVFEIVFYVRSFGEGSNSERRHPRLYFTEPPVDYCANVELVALMFDTKPDDGLDIQDISARTAQHRFDMWCDLEN